MSYHITDEQWEVIKPVIVRPKRLETRGRKRQADRPLLDGMLWVLKTGAQWHELPKEYPPYQSCHRRFQEWTDRGVFDKVIETVARDMEKRGDISLKECFIDGTFASAKKGALVLVPQSGAKVAKSWSLQTKTLFQSPSMWPVLLRTKSLWLKKQLPKDLPERLQYIL